MNKAYLFPLATISVLAFCEPEAYADLDPLGDTNCGQLGQPACLFGQLEWSEVGNFGCDRGLTESSLLNASCINDTRETIPVDNWPSKALRLQRELQADMPFHMMTVLNSHNAFNNSNDSYGFPNQIYSITDQLRMGVRSLSLDVHWAYGALRLCHSAGDIPGLLDHAWRCGALDRTFHQVIEELNQWMRRPENSNEVVFLDMETYTDGRDADLEEVISEYLDDLWLRPSEFNNLKAAAAVMDRPTLNEIRATGKRLVGFLNYGSNAVFSESFKPENMEDQNPTYFVAATCSFGQPSKPMDPYLTIRDNKVRYGAAEDSLDGSKSRITPTMLQQLTECNVTAISLDQITPETIQAAVWSWEQNQPDNSNDEDCVEMGPNGRWNDVPCDDGNRYYACSDSDGKTWKVTDGTGPSAGGSAACAAVSDATTTYKYAVPRDGYQNNELRTLAQGRKVWLNLNDSAVEGSWTDSTVNPAPTKQVLLVSWKGDYLHRPDSAQGVTTWYTGNEWTIEEVSENKIRLKSWKGDYLHRPDSAQGVTTWNTGLGNEWTLLPTSL